VTPLSAFVLFTAYSITSAYLSDGVCITKSGSPNLLPNVSVLSSDTADPTAFQSSALSALIAFLGFESCDNGEAGLVIYPSATDKSPVIQASASGSTAAPAAFLVSVVSTIAPSLASLNTSVLAIPTSASTASSALTSSSPPQVGTSRLPKRDKVAISVVVPIICIAFILPSAVFLLQRRRKKNGNVKDGNNIIESSEDHPPYLQPKGELEAKEKRHLELDA